MLLAFVDALPPSAKARLGMSPDKVKVSHSPKRGGPCHFLSLSTVTPY